MIVAVLVIDLVKQRLRKHVTSSVPAQSRIPQTKVSTPPPVSAPNQQRRNRPRPVPEEGIRVTPPSPIVDDAPAVSGQDTAEPDWRDAVIYSEILKTKF